MLKTQHDRANVLSGRGPSIFSFGEDEPGELYFTNTQGSVMHFRSTVDKQAKQ